MPTVYDVIVIGGGLGGLTTAQRLATLGHKVLILEQHYLLGGLATWFTRPGGHIFDISLHGFPYGMVKTCRKYWTQEIADSIIQLKDIRFDNPQFNLSTTFDREDFTRLLTGQFGITPENVDAFFKTARQMDFFDDRSMTTRRLFERYFPGRHDVWRLLMEPIAYANGSTLDDPALTYGIVFSNFMSKGVFTFAGGTNILIRKMRRELLRNGVEIKIRTPVERILVEGREVKGVRTADGETIAAKAVVSNANLLTTVQDMVGPEHFDADFFTDAEAVRLNNSSCQVYMGVRNGEHIDPIGDLLFTSTHPTFDSDALLAKDPSSMTFSVYYPKIRPNRREKRYSIVCSMNANYHDWENLSPEAYERDKARLIEKVLSRLDHYLPGIRDKLDWVEAATPRTFRRYTLHRQGASFGTKFEGIDVTSKLPEQVQGLYHAGSVAIIMSGWLGAMNYGVIVSNKVDAYLSKVAAG